jgi:hypothetical protein
VKPSLPYVHTVPDANYNGYIEFRRPTGTAQQHLFRHFEHWKAANMDSLLSIQGEKPLRHSHQIRAPTETQQAIYVRQSPGPVHEGLGPDILEYGNEMPLNGRGWIFQERLLSRRVLNMCGEEMVWECNTHTKCECTKLGDFSGSFKHSFTRIVCNEVAHPSVFIEM